MTAEYLVRRGLAALIDSVVVIVFVGFLSAIGLALAYVSPVDIRWPGGILQTLMTILYLTLGYSWIAVGATLGKRIFRLKVVGNNGQPTSLARAFLRATLVVFLSGAVFLTHSIIRAVLLLDSSEAMFLSMSMGIAASLFLPMSILLGSGRGLHDLIARTSVVNRTASEHTSLPQSQPVVWLAARSLLLAFAVGILLVAVAFAPLLSSFLGDERPERLLTKLARSNLAGLSGTDITQHIHLMSETLPSIVEQASLRGGVLEVPSFSGQDGANLSREAQRGRWLSMSFVLSPTYTRNHSVREALANVAAQYVSARYDTGNVFVLVSAHASARFGVAALFLREDLVVKFGSRGVWRVVRPDRSRNINIGWSPIGP